MSAWKPVLGMLFLLLVVGLLAFYWIIPTETIQFGVREPLNYNFSLTNASLEDMQFYPRMRYPYPEISYRISSACTLQKRYDMETALDILANKTILNFYPVSSNEEITIECDDVVKVKEDFFIAGEGGPTSVTITPNFNVIFEGSILLLRDSKCERPNVAIHELLHALGFAHSENPQNIMYAYSRCDQTIGDDIPLLINELYSVESYPDLVLENVSAQIRGRYLDVNLTVRNYGLIDSEEFEILVFVGDKIVKTFESESIPVGFGKSVYLSNILVLNLNVEEIKIEIVHEYPELEKKNNIIKLNKELIV